MGSAPGLIKDLINVDLNSNPVDSRAQNQQQCPIFMGWVVRVVILKGPLFSRARHFLSKIPGPWIVSLEPLSIN